MNLSESESIKKFYDGAEMFITGGSGFIGKTLIEKLLRSCPGIRTIYVLMRPKKNKTLEDRINDMTDSMLFDLLRQTNPRAIEKLHVIEGDVMNLNLGISDLDLEKLKSCSIIFHAAASVRFDDPLKKAVLLNTRGTRETCRLAMTMANLKAFVHVSTAYIQPKNFYVKEQLYEPDGDWKSYIDFAEKLDENLMNSLGLKLTEFAPNTYVFTKHMAEQVCVDYKEQFNLPIIIFRPSIVTITERDPFCGWCDNLNGPGGLVFAAAFAITHVSTFPGDNQMDLVPSDICVKAIIIAAFKMGRDRGLEMDIPIYNACSFKVVSYNALDYEKAKVMNEFPPPFVFGIPSHIFTSCWILACVVRIFRHLIPALIVDTLLKAIGNEPKIMKVQRLIHNAEKSLKYFTDHVFKFDNYNFIDLKMAIPPSEKEDFSLDESGKSYAELMAMSFHVSLKAVFKFTDKDFEKGKKRAFYIYAVTRMIHATVLFGILALINYLVT